MIFTVGALFLLLFPLVLAFTDTSPIVAWSSHSSGILDRLPSKLTTTVHSISLLESILLESELCDHDAIVLVHHPGLHATDLRTLSPSSNLARSFTYAVSSRQFPYVRNPSPSPCLSLSQSVSSRCNSRHVNFTLGQEERVVRYTNEKHVVCLSMPPLEGTAGARKVSMAELDSLLASELDVIAHVFSNHLVIISGSNVSKRQLADSLPNTIDVSEATIRTGGGILAYYQILTPGLLTTLLVVFLVLVPVVLMGITALANIQSPLRIGASKGYNAEERKNQ